MAASLELRPPFLDAPTGGARDAAPSSAKIRDGQTKWVLKEVARRYLPDGIVDRPKVGSVCQWTPGFEMASAT